MRDNYYKRALIKFSRNAGGHCGGGTLKTRMLPSTLARRKKDNKKNFFFSMTPMIWQLQLFVKIRNAPFYLPLQYFYSFFHHFHLFAGTSNHRNGISSTWTLMSTPSNILVANTPSKIWPSNLSSIAAPYTTFSTSSFRASFWCVWCCSAFFYLQTAANVSPLSLRFF